MKRKWAVIASAGELCDEYEPVAPTGRLPTIAIPDEEIVRYFRARSAWQEANAAMEGYFKELERIGGL